MKLAFGGVISLILLGLYVYSIWLAISVVECISGPNCTAYPLSHFTDGMVQALTLIGGLVSALVIAELAITAPGQAPMARALDSTASSTKQTTLKVVTALYLLAWLGSGLAAYVVGQMLHPKVLQPLTDLGQSWLGLAVAAGYAYFGIKPKS
jgi:hypothetical protein